jgi:hypothetical protein
VALIIIRFARGGLTVADSIAQGSFDEAIGG